MATHGDLVGTRIFGEYTITRKLGEGGMGAVYLARNEAIGQEIGIKVLHGRAAESDELLQRFNREARVISMLTHPNIIRVFIFGRTEQNVVYMAMEYVKGRSLRETLSMGLLDEISIIKIMKQACSALAESHDLGIIHRDLKPDNVLLTEFRGEPNFVKVLDFGIAKIQDQEGQQQLTQAGIVYGTPEYLSPEQAQAQPLDNRTDIYSLGVMLYEMMVGKVPFQSNSAVQVLTMHVFNEPVPAEQVAPNRISPTMAAIIRKAMAKKPVDRFKSAMELFRALEAREREIVNERRIDSSAMNVPGSELTGMFMAVPTAEQMALQPRPQAAPAPLAQPQQPQNHATQAASPVTDPTRKVIITLIVLMVLLLIVLVTAGVALYFK